MPLPQDIRPVFQDENIGWQFVLDEYGRRVYGMWLFTEAEWQACTEPDKMLQFLLHRGGANPRKLKLFACAWSGEPGWAASRCKSRQSAL